MNKQTPTSWYRDILTHHRQHPSPDDAKAAGFTVVEIEHPGYNGSMELEHWLREHCSEFGYHVSYTFTPVYIAFGSAADAIAYKFVREDQWKKNQQPA